jgi:hypothetical protein
VEISIIVVSYNTCALLRNCLSSVQAQTRGVTYEVFVVDNASSDDSCAMVEREFPEVRLLRNSENRGFSKANNQAIKVSEGDYVLLLNSDTVLENNAVGIMYKFMQAHCRAAVCGPLLLNADKTVQRSIDTHPSAISMMLRRCLGAHRNRYWRLLRDNYHPGAFDYSKCCKIPDGWLTGAVLMIRRAAFEEVGLLDEAYHFMNEDADWGLAVSHSGWETWLVPEAVVTHLLGGSRNSLSEKQEVALKLANLRQDRYYVRKNLGLARYGIYRLAVFCCHLMNITRRVIMVPFSSPAKRPHAAFKCRLAWQMLLASMEIASNRPAQESR